MAGARPCILIVGAGIVGASIAWHAARSGARVTVVEAGEPGGGATGRSLAWINASWGNPRAYFQLRLRAMEEWRHLERDLPAIRVDWSGGLLWDLPPDRLAAFAAEHAAWGYDIRLVDRVEALRIEPNLAAPPALAVHAAGEGAIDAAAAARSLLAAAAEMGAVVLPRTMVRHLALEHGRAVGVVTDSASLGADHVVIAAGAGTSALAATAGLALPIDDPASLLVVTAPQERVLRGLVMAPALHMRQTTDGRLVAAAGVADGDPADAAQDLLAAMRRFFRPAPVLTMASHALARRPIPAGGLPILGAAGTVDGLYIAAMHSGVTLAAAVGRFVAREIVDGVSEPLLAPFGLARLRAAMDSGAES